MTPRVTRVRQDNTHRLIPARYSDDNVLTRLTESSGELRDLVELERATNDRLLGEANLLPGINVHELLFGVAYAHIVNAAFTHAQPGSGRFNDSDRGAWYAAFQIETARVEVSFHKMQELKEIGWTELETFTFVDYLADFRSEFHDIRADSAFADCLDAANYSKSQSLARELLQLGSAGIVYPSARRKGGTCLACFRPALVANVRQGSRVTIELRAPGSIP